MANNTLTVTTTGGAFMIAANADNQPIQIVGYRAYNSGGFDLPENFDLQGEVEKQALLDEIEGRLKNISANTIVDNLGEASYLGPDGGGDASTNYGSVITRGLNEGNGALTFLVNMNSEVPEIGVYSPSDEFEFKQIGFFAKRVGQSDSDAILLAIANFDTTRIKNRTEISIGNVINLSMEITYADANISLDVSPNTLSPEVTVDISIPEVDEYEQSLITSGSTEKYLIGSGGVAETSRHTTFRVLNTNAGGGPVIVQKDGTDWKPVGYPYVASAGGNNPLSIGTPLFLGSSGDYITAQGDSEQRIRGIYGSCRRLLRDGDVVCVKVQGGDIATNALPTSTTDFTPGSLYVYKDRVWKIDGSADTDNSSLPIARAVGGKNLRVRINEALLDAELEKEKMARETAISNEVSARESGDTNAIAAARTTRTTIFEKNSNLSTTTNGESLAIRQGSTIWRWSDFDEIRFTGTLTNRRVFSNTFDSDVIVDNQGNALIIDQTLETTGTSGSDAITITTNATSNFHNTGRTISTIKIYGIKYAGQPS